MKTWQIVVLIYLVAAVVGLELGVYHAPVWMSAVAAFWITLLGLRLIHLLKKPRNPNR